MSRGTVFQRIWASLDPDSQDRILGQFGTAGKVVNVVRKANASAQAEAVRSGLREPDADRAGDDDDDDDVIDAEFVELDEEPGDEDETSLLESLVVAFIPDLDDTDDEDE